MLIISRKRYRKIRLFIYIKEVYDYLYLRIHGVETELGFVTLNGMPIIGKCGGSRIILEKNVTLVSRSKDNVAGVNHPVILATLSENAIIRIGEGSGLSGATLCAASEISIGKRCGIGANVSLYDTDFHPINPLQRHHQSSILDAPCKPILIGDDVWIGANATLLKGSSIGDAGVVGACSVVTGAIPSRTIVAGNPARVIGCLD